MEDKRFFRILIAVCIICFLLTVTHCIYAYKAYENSSIIHLMDFSATDLGVLLLLQATNNKTPNAINTIFLIMILFKI